MNFSMRFNGILCGFLFSTLAPAALADSDGTSITDAVEYRQSLMNVYRWNVKPMGEMVKGDLEYDQEAFAGYAGDLAAAVNLELLAAFPEESENSDETDALPDIWLDFEGFENKFKALQDAAQALKAAADTGDAEQTKTAFAKVGKSCKSCHEAFRN